MTDSHDEDAKSDHCCRAAWAASNDAAKDWVSDTYRRSRRGFTGPVLSIAMDKRKEFPGTDYVIGWGNTAGKFRIEAGKGFHVGGPFEFICSDEFLQLMNRLGPDSRIVASVWDGPTLLDERKIMPSVGCSKNTARFAHICIEVMILVGFLKEVSAEEVAAGAKRRRKEVANG